MVVLILERVPTSLRGDLSRWMIEPRTGVFVGTPNARVRDLLWRRVQLKLRGGAAVMVHTADSEQGFSVRLLGELRRELVDFEGLALIRVPRS